MGKKKALVDPSIEFGSEFEGLAYFEEIPSYQIATEYGGREVLNTKSKNKKGKKLPEKLKETKSIDEEEENIKKTKKRKKKKKIPANPNQNSQVNGKEAKPNQSNKRKAPSQEIKKEKKSRYDNAGYLGSVTPSGKKIDVEAWKEIGTPDPVVKSIKHLGFERPTEIQQLTIPHAIKYHRDIIGAAETGSGKTLAFGIPIINGILDEKKLEGIGIDSGLESSSDEEELVNGEGEKEDESDTDDSSSEDELQVLDPSTFDFAGNDLENRQENVIETQDVISDADDEDEEEEEAEEKEEGNEINDDDDGDIIENGDGEADDFDFGEHNEFGEGHEGSDEMGEEYEDYDEMGEEYDEGEEYDGNPEKLGCVKVIKNVRFDFETADDEAVKKFRPKKLYALIITPTRELAVQINSHLLAVLKYTGIKTAVVVGGMSTEKQKRQLYRGPEIVIGTPGRLWELLKQGDHHLIQIPYIRYLAIDETDRMVEFGHFRELSNLLEMINSEEKYKEKRQTFVFSATLTMLQIVPEGTKAKNKGVDKSIEMKIEKLVTMIGLKKKRKVVDVTRAVGTTETLTEAKIICDLDEKDYYLYYFATQYPGRTLVFCNSIKSVRRLHYILEILQCEPQSIHAEMHQRQRLKNLERFATNPRGFLIATDVAARGLDIPNIQHVIHYQVPKTAETYVHRSGRTARATREGLSVLLVAPGEVHRYSIMFRTLKKESDLPSFPIDPSLMQQVQDRVNMARILESKERLKKTEKAKSNWIEKMAKEAMLESDTEEDDEQIDQESRLQEFKKNRELKSLQAKMALILRKPLMSSNLSRKFPTQHGILVDPFSKQADVEEDGSNRAVNVVKKGSKEYSDLVKKVKNMKVPVKKERISKKQKGYAKRKKRREEIKAIIARDMKKQREEKQQERKMKYMKE